MVRIHAEIGRIYAALKDRLAAEEGQAMVEYALILALVSIVAIAVLQAMGVNISGLFSRVNSALTSVNS